MFQWERLGRVFDPEAHRDELWTKEFAQSPSVLPMEDRIRVYFVSRPSPDASGKYVSHLSYFDLAAEDPTKIVNMCQAPILALGGIGAFDEFGTNPISVIRDGEKVRVYYAGWTRCESVPFNAAIGLALSHDGGHTFERIGPGPVLSYSLDEPFLLGSPRIRKFGDRWWLWYVAGRKWIRGDNKQPEPVYKIRCAHSEDGVIWTKLGVDLLADKLGEDECQACADVTYRDGRYHMFFSYRQAHGYKGGEGGYRIGYAFSEDLRSWTRRDELAAMHPAGGNGWDSKMVSYPHVFSLGVSTYMLYQGNEMGRTGLGLAKLIGPAKWNFS